MTIGKKDRTRDVPQEDMVRTLNLDEKFGLAVPMLDVGEPIKGRRPWERYLHLKGIRDDLVHVKDRGVDPDRAVRTVRSEPHMTGFCSAMPTPAPGTPWTSCRRHAPGF